MQLTGVDGPVAESSGEVRFLFLGQNGIAGAHIDPITPHIQNHFTLLWMEICSQTNLVIRLVQQRPLRLQRTQDEQGRLHMGRVCTGTKNTMNQIHTDSGFVLGDG